MYVTPSVSQVEYFKEILAGHQSDYHVCRLFFKIQTLNTSQTQFQLSQRFQNIPVEDHANTLYPGWPSIHSYKPFPRDFHKYVFLREKSPRDVWILRRHYTDYRSARNDIFLSILHPSSREHDVRVVVSIIPTCTNEPFGRSLPV